MAMWADLVLKTFVKPREAAAGILCLDLPVMLLLEAAVAVTCLGLVVGFASVMMQPGMADAVSTMVLSRPLLGVLIQLAFTALAVLLTYRVGAAFGGKGNLRGALAIIVWLNVVMLLIQVVQFLALMLAPAVARFLAIATLGWLLFAFSASVAELHGFKRALPVLGGVIITAFITLFVLAFVLSMLGLVPQGIY